MEVDPEVQSAYGKRADVYAAALGAVDQMHPDDSDQIRIWGRRFVGPVLDIGCGPGHWTDFLHRTGADIRGVDPVPEFTAYARGEFPGVDFRTASLNSTGADQATLAGVLCWYSLIHIPPQQMGFSLTQIHRLLRPGGELLVGFFRHLRTDLFEHAITPAYRWSVDHFAGDLHAAGFTICDIHQRTDPDARPHASIRAIKPRLR